MFDSLRILTSRLRGLLARPRLDEEFERELQTHLDLMTEENIRRGLSPDEARRAARIRLGGVTQLHETHRELWGMPQLETILQDVRYALRMLRKNTGVTAVVLLSLALGIGANTAIFSLLNAVVLKSLPVPDPQKLVRFSETSPEGNENSNMSWPYFKRIHDQNHTLSGVFAFSEIGRVNVSFDGKSDLATCQVATGDFFSTLGLLPAAGRFYTPEDDDARRPVVVISYSYWQRRFGGDLSVIGKPISLNHIPFTLIGVTPVHFAGLEVGDSPEVTAPMMTLGELSTGAADWEGPFDSWLEVMGRLKPGVAKQQAQAEFDVIYHRLLTEFEPSAAPDQRQYIAQMLQRSRLNVREAAQGFDGGVRRDFSLPLRILMLTVGAVLLIACANVANLLLARATARQKEVAVRLAIGASRARLIRQLLTESILLAVIGGALGALVAWWGSQLLLRMVSTGDTPLPVDLSPDLRVLAFTAGISILMGILFGLAPALRATRVNLTPSLKEGRSQTGRHRNGRSFGLDQILVVAQVAISLTLLVGAGLFVRSLQKLWAIDPGYNRNNLLMFSLDPRLAGYKDNTSLANVYREVSTNLQAIPGVQSVSESLVRPVDDETYWMNRVQAIDGRRLSDDQGIRIAVNAVGPGYFVTMGTPLLSGREFNERDNAQAPPVAVISAGLARRCFGNANPLGHFIARHGGSPYQVIGVVQDSRYGNVRDLPPAVLYTPFFQVGLADVYFSTTYEVRYLSASAPLLGAVHHQLQAIDSGLAMFRVETLDVQTRNSFVKERLIATLSSFFGLLAMSLACIGLYGTMSYDVVRRTGEIGLRMALGARQSDVRWMVLKDTLSMVTVGVAAGLACALVAWRQLQSQLYGVKPADAVTLVLGSLLLVTVALVAGYIPARRASRLEPMVALRNE